MSVKKVLLLLAAVAVPPGIVGIAAATEPAGVDAVAHVAGARLDGVKAHADGIRLQAKAPTDVSVVTLTLRPGGTTGWHTHPGVAVIAVAEGTGRLYAADCSSRAYRAGEAFVETGDDAPTVFRNESAEPVVLTVTFLAPAGEPVLEDGADQGCGVR